MGEKYKDNLQRTILTIGMALLAVVVLGVGMELWLNSQTAPAGESSVSGPMAMLGLTFWATMMALPVIVALVAIPLQLMPIVEKLYVTKDLGEAHNVLNRLVFGKIGRGPLVIVKEGKIARGEDSFAARVGGPSQLVIHADTAVVTEQYGSIKRILGPGLQSLERFEKIWEIIDLRPQRYVLEVFALTKEGIPISCKADLSFQIDDQPQEPGGKVHEGAYPFAEDAVFRAATSKWIREPSHPEHHRTWVGRVVSGVAEGLLRNILAEYRLDWLIASPQPGQRRPREEIRRRFEEGLRGGVGGVGAKILGVQIGTIEVKARDEDISRKLSEIVSRQRLEVWNANWEARALVGQAEGEAKLLDLDMARIQAQAEMVVTLTEALQSTMSQGTVEPYILALRFVETLRWMSYNTFTREFMPPEAMRTLMRLQEVLETKNMMSRERDAIQEPLDEILGPMEGE